MRWYLLFICVFISSEKTLCNAIVQPHDPMYKTITSGHCVDSGDHWVSITNVADCQKAAIEFGWVTNGGYAQQKSAHYIDGVASTAASTARDGNPNTFTHTATWGKNPWWRLTWADGLYISRVEVTNRKEHGDRLNGAQVQVDRQNDQWYNCGGVISGALNGDKHTFDCTGLGPDEKAWGVRIRNFDPNNILSLAEVVVYAVRQRGDEHNMWPTECSYPYNHWYIDPTTMIGGLHDCKDNYCACVKYCPVGTHHQSGTTDCLPCQGGQYQDDSGQSSCKSCASGQYQDDSGQSSCKTCASTACGTGSTETTPCSSASNRVCTQHICTCANGVAATGAACTTNGANICASCDSGYYKPITSDSGQSSCKSCAWGQYSGVGASSCPYSATTCPAGTYASGAAACKTCASGTYSTVGTFNSCPYSATTCPAGTYASGAAACKTCASGTYSTVGTFNSCPYSATTCPAGTYASGTATVCDSCGTGKYNEQTSQTSESVACKSCAAGQYQDDSGQSSCKTCASGTYSGVGASSCFGVYKERTSGKCGDSGGESIITTIAACSAGAEALGGWDTTADMWFSTTLPPGCVATSHGLRWNGWLPSVVDCGGGLDPSCICTMTCPPGEYQDQSGQSSCKTCPSGQYQDDSGQSSCKSCAGGQYQDDSGQSSCKTCASTACGTGSTETTSCSSASNRVCTPNVCSCANGVAATGADCTTHGDHICSSCFSEYYKTYDTKTYDTFVCNNGKAQSGHNQIGTFTGQTKEQCETRCLQDLTCVSFDWADWTNNKICYLSTTKADKDGGALVTGAGMQYCERADTCTGCTASCGAGTRETTACSSASNRVCTQNVCSCANGVEATGTACTAHDTNICSSCASGYYKTGNTCAQNVCSCDNGVAATGAACTTHGANICASCGSGYYKTGNTCTQNVCSCANGVEVTGTACTTHGANICASCHSADANFHLGYCTLKLPNGDGTTSSQTVAGTFDDDTLRHVVYKWDHEDYRQQTVDLYGPIEDWDVSEVTNMDWVFAGFPDFNADLSKWDTSKVTTMDAMFMNAKSYHQTLCGGAWLSLSGWSSAFTTLGGSGSDASTARYGCCPVGSYMKDPTLNPFSEAESCAACPTGQHSSTFPDDITSCTQDECTCTNGIAVTGAACTGHNAHICKSCYSDYCQNGGIATGIGGIATGSGTTGLCGCDCKNGFSGDNCNECAEGKGFDGGECVTCERPQINSVTSHSAPCAPQYCPNGEGVTSDNESWVPDGNNCQDCGAGYSSPAGTGQCVDIDECADDPTDVWVSGGDINNPPYYDFYTSENCNHGSKITTLSKNTAYTFKRCISTTPYKTRSSGFCTDDPGWSNIVHEEECHKAVDILQLQPNDDTTDYTDYRPTGCIIQGILLFNTKSTTRPCGQYGYDCICKGPDHPFWIYTPEAVQDSSGQGRRLDYDDEDGQTEADQDLSGQGRRLDYDDEDGQTEADQDLSGQGRRLYYDDEDWQNNDDEDWQIGSTEGYGPRRSLGSWDDGDMYNETFGVTHTGQFTFTTGTEDVIYHCTTHPTMRGTLSVVDYKKCQNGGTCTDGVNSYTCACAAGYSGDVCSSCASGFRKTGDTCTPNVCTCANGVAANETACTAHDANICSSCSGEFYKTGNTCTGCTTCGAGERETTPCSSSSNRVCAQNVCTCANGVASTGTACTANGANICSSCASGYYKTGNTCTGCASGQYQDQSGHSSCKTCASGTYSGVGASSCFGMYKDRTSGKCGDSGGGWGKITSAAACEAGAAAMRWFDTTAWSLETTSRVEGCYYDVWGSGLFFNKFATTWSCGSDRRCLCTLTCPPGTYQDQSGQAFCKTCASGQYQEQSGQSSCKPCAAYWYSTVGASSCQYLQGTCPPGTYTNLAEQACKTCTNGQYNTGAALVDYRNSRRRRRRTWGVVSGPPTVTCSICTLTCAIGTRETTACTLTTNRVCTQNECVCDNGVAATGAACTTHGAHICSSCSSDHYKTGNTCTGCTTCATGKRQTTACTSASNRVCTQNDCSCDNGVAATGAACTTDGANICSSCDSGYSGNDCATNIDDCASSPCQNGGNCTDGVNSYTCACAAGYSGNDCATNIDDCASSPCQNGGTCTDGVNSYTCACTKGFTGTTCNECGIGKGKNATTGHCADCTHPNYNSVTTHDAACAVQNCTDGQGVTSDNATWTTTGGCEDCKDGYESPNGSGQCRAADCAPTQISNSNKATNDSVKGKTGQSVDVTCDTGYHSSTTSSSVQCRIDGSFTSMTCDPNVCSCANGVEANETACTTHGSNICSSCASGYHKRHMGCAPNICSCTNGVVATGTDCTSHQTNICSSCSSGFSKYAHIEPYIAARTLAEEEAFQANQTLRAKIDAKDLLIKTIGLQASSLELAENLGDDVDIAMATEAVNFARTEAEDKEIAAEAAREAETAAIDAHICARNVCSCANGVIATGTACTTHDANICSSCSSEYYKTGDTCTGLPCSGGANGHPCLNGGNATGTTGDCGCACQNGFSGDNCNECAEGKGFDGGNCVTCERPEINSVTSHSAPCAEQTCPNGEGVTSDNELWVPDGNNCQDCGAGYGSPYGTGQCVDIDECAPSPCQNGGKCTDGVNSYSCACAEKYTGATCETLVITSETSVDDIRVQYSDKKARMNQFKMAAIVRKNERVAAIQAAHPGKPRRQKRERVKASKMELVKEDLPAVYNTIKLRMKAKIAYVVVEDNSAEPTNCVDSEDGIPNCCSYDFSQDTDTSVMVGLEETVGAWSVLCDGATIVSKQTRKTTTDAQTGIAEFDMGCWDGSKFANLVTKATGDDHTCSSYRVLVGSQTNGELDPCANAFTTANITVDVGANTASGVSVNFTCQAGYESSGQATCTNGTWDQPTCDATQCGANEFVSNHVCEDCADGTTNAAGDDASGSDTTCDATRCGVDEYVSNHICVDCPSGTENEAGDYANDTATTCDATRCAVNEYVSNHLCVVCAPGTTNVAGDYANDTDTTCTATRCGADERVESNACVACPSGTTNVANDDASGSNTTCDPTICQADQKVVSNACVACPDGTTNVANDDASGSDTTCTATLCGANEYVSGHVCTTCYGVTTNAAGDDASGSDTQCVTASVVCIHPDVTVHVLVGVSSKAVAVGSLEVGDLVIGEGRTSTVKRVARFKVEDEACLVPKDLCEVVSDGILVSRTHAVRCPSWPTNTWTFCQPDWERVPTTEYVHVELESYLDDHLLSGSVVLESWDGYARAADTIEEACDKQGCPWPHKWAPAGEHRWTRVDLRQTLFDSSPRLRIERV